MLCIKGFHASLVPIEIAPNVRYCNRRRQFLRSAGGVVIAGVLAGCAGDSGGGGGDMGNTIDMNDDLKFVPDTFEVAVGETVTWENVSSVEHSVTAYEDDIPEDAAYFASGDFDSESAGRNGYPDGSIAGGETYEHTFETAGEYQYFYIPHEQAGMKTSIKVQ